ncbi:peptide chain release factor 3 (plasmid) [Pseudalkalibacillus hwajinpoensis]|uniref:peptide chain release factor 3 n=1 Tax=Guptibacillus hwajinpoensis TaxID=208199 RepID=UPI00325AA899
MENHELNEKEIKKRRTFAIISHPDAGKTTLTEQLLFLGSAIRSPGTVKSRKSSTFATSDWMEIEKQRGISVTSSVMHFTYHHYEITILDTPGHEDFSEDTYRTLLAVDSVVMLIDAAKGIESQTKKLFRVCRDHGIPIFTFINKMDRYGKEPLELLEEIESVLNIETFSMNWPIGMGQQFKGVYDRKLEHVELYQPNKTLETIKLIDNSIKEKIPAPDLKKLKEDLLLIDEAGNSFSNEKIQTGNQTPVFFGSAISSFGVPSFLNHFIELAPSPLPRETSNGKVHPVDTTFSGFIFKIQANMNAAHRDRIAFLRICSGVFERGMTAYLDRTGKAIRLSQGQQFFASNRNNIDTAYPGDIIGLYDPGAYQISDTLCGTKDTFSYGPLPQFPPEHFSKVKARKALKQKHFYKGIQQLAEEGAIQVYRSSPSEDVILGVVGKLQYEIFEYRMKHEYGVDLQMDDLPHILAKWIEYENPATLLKGSSNLLVYDVKQRPVILFASNFSLRWFQQHHPNISLFESPPERKE